MLLSLAWRNLGRQRRRTALTAGAIAFSTMLLVFVVELQFGGYDLFISTTLKVATGMLQVQRKGWLDKPKLRTTLPRASELARALRSLPGAGGVALRAQTAALASSASRSCGLLVMGVEPEREGEVSTVPRQVRRGRWLKAGAREAVIGELLAGSLKLKPGDDLTLLGSAKDGSVAATVLPVAGVFKSGMPELDRQVVELPLAAFQELFGLGDEAHSIVIEGGDLSRMAELEKAVRARLPPGGDLDVLDWERLVPGLKQIIQMDMLNGWFTYALLIAIVTFSILNTFLMTVLERTREFGLMLALGISPLRIGLMVMLESFLLTVLGVAAGLVMGAALTLWLQRYGFTFPGMKELYAQYGMPGVIYPRVTPVMFLAGPAAIFVSTWLASLVPLRRIRRLEAVEALRSV